ncbi:hypothetical protein AgCh_010149 [Apium graveolens]
MRQRRWLELIKDYDYEILYHPGKAKMVANALSIKERLKMKMPLGELIRDFEKMGIEVKVTGAGTETLFEIAIQPELSKKIILCQEKVMNEGREPMTGEEINTKKDDKGITREYRMKNLRITLEVLQGKRKGQRGGRHSKCMDSVWLAIKIPRKTNDDCRIKLSKMEAAKDEVVPSMVDEVAERKMLGLAVVQRTRDIIDLIRRRLVVAQDGHEKHERTRNMK